MCHGISTLAPTTLRDQSKKSKWNPFTSFIRLTDRDDVWLYRGRSPTKDVCVLTYKLNSHSLVVPTRSRTFLTPCKCVQTGTGDPREYYTRRRLHLVLVWCGGCIPTRVFLSRIVVLVSDVIRIPWLITVRLGGKIRIRSPRGRSCIYWEGPSSESLPRHNYRTESTGWTQSLYSRDRFRSVGTSSGRTRNRLGRRGRVSEEDSSVPNVNYVCERDNRRLKK